MKIHILLIIYVYTPIDCFIPNQFVQTLASRLNRQLNLDQASETLTHGEITKRGLIKSIAKFLSEQESGAKGVRMSRMSVYMSDIHYLYNDFYSKWIKKLEIDNLIETSFRINVAMVDFDDKFKDLPQAHFDANKFVESNQRVIDYSRSIITGILRKDYATARKLAAEVLHTIQDFYSHSNWIEMGNENRINDEIGTLNFSNAMLKVYKLNWDNHEPIKLILHLSLNRLIRFHAWKIVPTLQSNAAQSWKSSSLYSN